MSHYESVVAPAPAAHMFDNPDTNSQGSACADLIGSVIVAASATERALLAKLAQICPFDILRLYASLSGAFGDEAGLRELNRICRRLAANPDMAEACLKTELACWSRN